MGRFSIIFAFIICTGCSTSVNPIYAPADRIAMTALPEYKYYVQNDERLSPQEKEIRVKNVESFMEELEEYKRGRDDAIRKAFGFVGSIFSIFGI